MAKVVWTDPAIADLGRIFDYLARETQSTDRAEALCLELLDTAQSRLQRSPHSGAPVEELRDFGARELYKHGYRIIYVHQGDAC
jgi:plasmid stabilization system protein ParE